VTASAFPPLRGDQLSRDELRAWRGLLRVHAAVIKALDAELEARHGVPLSSYEVLMFLSEAPEGRLRMCELADGVLLSRSGLTRLVDRLERQGLIARACCPQDARGAFAVLTEAGRDLVARARPTHLDGVRRSFLDHLTPPERERLGDLWERVLAATGSPLGGCCR
jgi:DNA-binding MarR family transcriptional regulator